MTKSVQVRIVFSQMFTILLTWNDNIHASILSVSNDFIGIITAICQQCFRRYTLN